MITFTIVKKRKNRICTGKTRQKTVNPKKATRQAEGVMNPNPDATVQKQSPDQRREPRFQIDSVVLPFLGSRIEDHSVFEYLIIDISIHGIQIALPRWVVKRESLKKGDIIDFHLPFELNNATFHEGLVAWLKHDGVTGTQTCGASIHKMMPLTYPVYISFETADISVDLQNFSSRSAILAQVVKDVVLIKKGVLVYLKHLAPFFSRVTQYSREEYPMLRNFLFEDIEKKIKENIANLDKIYHEILEKNPGERDIPLVIDLEQIRTCMESEIYPEIFNITFETDSHIPYIQAIMKLKNRTYLNYNTIVMLYIKALT